MAIFSDPGAGVELGVTVAGEALQAVVRYRGPETGGVLPGSRWVRHRSGRCSSRRGRRCYCWPLPATRTALRPDREGKTERKNRIKNGKKYDKYISMAVRLAYL